MKAFSFAQFPSASQPAFSLNSSSSTDASPTTADPLQPRKMTLKVAEPFTRCVKDIKTRATGAHTKHQPLGPVVRQGRGFTLRIKGGRSSKQEIYEEDGSFLSHHQLRNDIFLNQSSSNEMDHAFFDSVSVGDSSFHTPFQHKIHPKKTPKTTTVEDDELDLSIQTQEIVRRVRSLPKEEKDRLFRLVSPQEDELDCMVRRVDGLDVSFQFDQLVQTRSDPTWTPHKTQAQEKEIEKESFFDAFGLNVFRNQETSIAKGPSHTHDVQRVSSFPSVVIEDDETPEDLNESIHDDKGQEQYHDHYRVRVVEMVGSYQELSPGKYNADEDSKETSGIFERRIRRTAQYQVDAKNSPVEQALPSPPPSESFNELLSQHYERYCSPSCENPLASIRNMMFQSDDDEEEVVRDDDEEYTERIMGAYGYGVYTDKEVADVIRNPSKHLKQVSDDAAVIVRTKSEDLGRSTRETFIVMKVKSEDFGDSLRNMDCNQNTVSTAIPDLIRSVSEVGIIADAPIDDNGVKYVPMNKVERANRNWKELLLCGAKGPREEPMSDAENKPTVEASTPRIRNISKSVTKNAFDENGLHFPSRNLESRVLAEEPIRASVLISSDAESGGELYIDESIDNEDAVHAFVSSLSPSSKVITSSPMKAPMAANFTPLPQQAASSVSKPSRKCSPFKSSSTAIRSPISEYTALGESFDGELVSNGLGYC